MADSHFIDPMQTAYRSLAEVTGPGLFFDLHNPSGPMLICGAEDPYALFLEGEYRGECFAVQRGENWDGMLISSIEVEVDFTSACNPDEGGKRSLVMVRRGEALEVLGRAKERGFTQFLNLSLNSERARAGEQRLGFSRWRIAMTIGNDRRVLLNIDADEKG